MTFRARTTDNSTIQSAYLVYHSSKNAVAPEEFTDRIMGDMVTITPKETFIGNQPLSNMVIGKKYYAIQVTAPADTNAKKYQGNTVTTSRNRLLGVFTYSQPAACPMVLSSAAAPAAAPATAARAPAPATAAPAVVAAAPATTALQARTFDRQEPSSTAISDMSAQAKSLKQRMDILSDVQSLLKRKTLAKRRRPSKKKCCDCEDDCDCEDTCEKEEACPASDACQKPPAACPKSAARPKPSMALSQGKEYKRSCDHDMSQYIRKDSIPCWNCNLDY